MKKLFVTGILVTVLGLGGLVAAELAFGDVSYFLGLEYANGPATDSPASLHSLDVESFVQDVYENGLFEKYRGQEVVLQGEIGTVTREGFTLQAEGFQQGTGLGSLDYHYFGTIEFEGGCPTALGLEDGDQVVVRGTVDRTSMGRGNMGLVLVRSKMVDY